MIPRYAELPRGKAPNRINRARKSKEFVRTYLSVAFVKFVQRLHCIVDGCESTRSECAHVCDDGSKGAGRKSGWKCCAPVCTQHHRGEMHQWGEAVFAAKYALDLEAEAAKTQRLWERVEPNLTAEFECDELFDDDDIGGSPEPETES